MLLYYLLQRESQIIVLLCIWHLIMHFHTGNLYCSAVPTVFVSIFLTNKQPKNMKKQHPLLGFTFTTSLDVVLLMIEFHWKNKKICCMCGQEYLPDQLEHKDSTAIQNTSDISNTDDIHSCVTTRKHNISVHATYTPPCLTLATSIKRNVLTLPTYRWHPLIYTKYHLILQKYNKNNNGEYLILM